MHLPPLPPSPPTPAVMLSALLVAAPTYQLVMGRLGPPPRALATPQLTQAYCLPSPKAAPDLRLAAGALLFGTGEQEVGAPGHRRYGCTAPPRMEHTQWVRG